MEKSPGKLIECLFQRSRGKERGQIAIADGTAVLSYAQLAKHVYDRAIAKSREGCRPGRLVPVSGKHPCAWLVDLLATQAAGAASLLADPSGNWQPLLEQPVPEGVFLGSLTSGSTGRPKAVLRDEDSWWGSFNVMADLFGLPERPRLLVAGRPGYSAVLYAVLQTWFLGGTVTFAYPFFPERWTREIQNQDTCFLVPAQYRLWSNWLDRTRVRPADREGLTLISAGEKFHSQAAASLARHYPQGRLVEYYGSAETSFISCLTPELRVAGKETSVGRPAPGVQLQIARDGEILVHSPWTARYEWCSGSCEWRPLGDWVGPGDCGFLDQDGLLHLQGRADQQINRAGVKWDAAVLEKTLLALPEVDHAAAVALPGRHGEQVGLLVALREDDSNMRILCEQAARGCLPAGWRLQVRYTAGFPLTENGKPDRTKIVTFFA